MTEYFIKEALVVLGVLASVCLAFYALDLHYGFWDNEATRVMFVAGSAITAFGSIPVGRLLSDVLFGERRAKYDTWHLKKCMGKGCDCECHCHRMVQK